MSFAWKRPLYERGSCDVSHFHVLRLASPGSVSLEGWVKAIEETKQTSSWSAWKARTTREAGCRQQGSGKEDKVLLYNSASPSVISSLSTLSANLDEKVSLGEVQTDWNKRTGTKAAVKNGHFKSRKVLHGNFLSRSGIDEAH